MRLNAYDISSGSLVWSPEDARGSQDFHVQSGMLFVGNRGTTTSYLFGYDGNNTHTLTKKHKTHKDII